MGKIDYLLLLSCFILDLRDELSTRLLYFSAESVFRANKDVDDSSVYVFLSFVI